MDRHSDGIDNFATVLCFSLIRSNKPLREMAATFGPGSSFSSALEVEDPVSMSDSLGPCAKSASPS